MKWAGSGNVVVVTAVVFPTLAFYLKKKKNLREHIANCDPTSGLKRPFFKIIINLELALLRGRKRKLSVSHGFRTMF